MGLLLVLDALLWGDRWGLLATGGGEAGHSHCSCSNGNFKTLWNNLSNSHQRATCFPEYALVLHLRF